MAGVETDGLRKAVAQLQIGDETALTDIWDTHEGIITKVISNRNGGNYEAAREGANEVLLRTWRNRNKIDLSKHPNPRNWILEVA